MKTPDCSQNAYLRVLVKLMKPVAAGVLYPFFGLLLSPIITGAAMS